MSIPGYDAYWDNYQAMNDPQWYDDEREDEEAFYNQIDEMIDERLLERS